MEENIKSPVKNTSAFFTKYFSSTNLILLLILIAAAILRFHKLTFQSLWSDELSTMATANPSFSWGQFFNDIRYAEVDHPPLFFIFERYFLYFFGYNDWNARALCALAGIANVWAIFLLGKEIKNEKLGLTSAALLCVNYFCIYYSQEVRMYNFLMFFTILSYVYFLRVCKHLKNNDAILFIVFTVCVIYTHYFGILVVVSELVLAVIFLASGSGNRNKLFKKLFICEFIIGAVFIPLISNLKSEGSIHSSWIPPIKPIFFVNTFNEYFGDNQYIKNSSPLLSWIVLAFLIIYLIAVLRSIKEFKNFKTNPLILSFIFVFTTLVISLGIPYVRSVLVVPMLVSRYTIIILPSVIIAFAYGIAITPNNIIRYSLLGIFFCLSVRQMIFVSEYYRTVSKEQNRELAAYVSSNNQKYPLVNETFLMDYYLKMDSFKGSYFTDRQGTEKVIDSILRKSSPQYNIDTFWLVGIRFIPPLSAQMQKNLDTAYVVIKDTEMQGHLAQLYASASKTIDYTYFNPEQVFNNGEQVAAIWSDAVTARPVSLPKGKYNIIIESKGTPAGGIFPHNNVFINNINIGNFYSNLGNYYGDLYYNRHFFPFEQKRDTTITIKINMDNDIAIGKEDRNTFIRRIYIVKAQNQIKN